MPMTPGYYMPNYYGNYYPTLQTTATPMMQSYSSQPMQNQSGPGIIWVDGEVGAKAFQMPAGLPAGVPIPLWDTNDTVIYLKSINQMGMPNPLQKLHYTMEEQQNPNPLPSGGNVSGAPASAGMSGHDDSKYATKDDIESIRNEIREMLKPNGYHGNQSGISNKNGQNRGGNA